MLNHTLLILPRTAFNKKRDLREAACNVQVDSMDNVVIKQGKQ